MVKLLIFVLFIWMLFKAMGLAFRLTWGLAKIVAGILMVLAIPALVVTLLFAGGLILLTPLVMIWLATKIMKLCMGD